MGALQGTPRTCEEHPSQLRAPRFHSCLGIIDLGNCGSEPNGGRVRKPSQYQGLKRLFVESVDFLYTRYKHVVVVKWS